MSRSDDYIAVFERIFSLLDEDVDWIGAMSTVACELHNAFDHYDWTGFYRVTSERVLTVGPYQGGHGCLTISFDRGVCGAAADTLRTQLVPDVEKFPGHIACSSSTRSEIVVPVVAGNGELLAVLDVDSNSLEAFNDVDQRYLEELCDRLGERYGQ